MTLTYTKEQRHLIEGTPADSDLLLVPDTKWGVKGVFPGRRK